MSDTNLSVCIFWYMFICRLQHFRNNKEDVEFHVILSAHQPEY